MLQRLSLIVMAVIFCSLGFFTSAQAQNLVTQTVKMKSISYDPKQLTIKAGDAVEWENKSYTEHSATSDDGSTFDTGLIKPNTKTKKVTFKKPGRYPYHCSMHGKSMSGVILVTQ